RFPRHRMEVRVDLHAQDGGGEFAESGGEAARAGADLQGKIVLSQLGGAEQEVEQVQVDKEVLAEFVLWTYPACCQEVAQVRLSLSGWRRRGGHDRPSVKEAMHLATYFASRSVSKLTAAPACLKPSVVMASVCGMRATLNRSAPTSTKVRLTPSMA